MEWNYNPNDYTERSFELIPIGDHRVRISDVTERTFKSGNEGYEMILEVSGYKGRLWYYLVLDRSNPSQTNQRLGEFFESFNIPDYSMGTGKQWIGQVGGVRVKHELYNGNNSAKVQYLLTQERQSKLPPWQVDDSGLPYMPQSPMMSDLPLPNELPFA